jgi:polyisoprenoid-binding protein YceI
MKRLAILLAVLAAPLLASAQTSTWEIDPSHSHASFTVRHMLVTNVRGEFQKMTGQLVLDEADVTKSTVEVSIDANTINTREPKRDEHLRSPDFFNVAKNPTLSFKSTRVEKVGEGKLKVTGNLTMNGVTRSVAFDVMGPTAPVANPWGKIVRGVAASTTVSRKDFGLLWNKVVEAGPVVGDEVKVELEFELSKKEAKQASN